MRIMAMGVAAVLVCATAALAADAGRPHHRRGGPPQWCNQGNSVNGGMMECSYHTLQQCLAGASGVGGTCIPNPAYEWARYYRERPHGWRY